MTSTSIKKNWIRNSRRILDSYAKYRAIIHTDCESRSNSIVSQTCSFHERINFVTCKTRLQLCYFRSSSRITVIVELYRSRFSTHRLVEKKIKRKKKKRIVDRLFNFKANYRAPRINFEFLTFHIRKTDSEIYSITSYLCPIDFCSNFAKKGGWLRWIIFSFLPFYPIEIVSNYC